MSMEVEIIIIFFLQKVFLFGLEGFFLGFLDWGWGVDVMIQDLSTVDGKVILVIKVYFKVKIYVIDKVNFNFSYFN